MKHFLIDFVNQTDEEVACKGMYGHCLGINHSLKHGVGTFIVLFLVTGLMNFNGICALALLDFALHYHIDYIKQNYSRSGVNTKSFWVAIGLDQMAHQFTYLFIVYCILQR